MSYHAPIAARSHDVISHGGRRPDRRLAGVLAGSAFGLACVAPSAFAQPASLSLANRAYAHVSASGQFQLQQFTLAAWVHPTGPGENGGGTILTGGQRDGSGTYLCSWWTGWATNGHFVGMVVNQFNIRGTVVTSQAVVPIGQTAHMAFTFDGVTLRMYVNGVLDQSIAYGFSGVDYTTMPEVNIGAFLNATGYTFNRFAGQIDDAAVWGRALSGTEVMSLMGCQTPARLSGLMAYYPFTSNSLADASGHGHQGLAVGSVAFGANLPTGTACVADIDDGSGSGMCDGGVTIDDLLYYLGLFEQGLAAADVDDGTSTGTPDGGVTIDDLLYYLVRFEGGC